MTLPTSYVVMSSEDCALVLCFCPNFYVENIIHIEEIFPKFIAKILYCDTRLSNVIGRDGRHG